MLSTIIPSWCTCLGAVGFPLLACLKLVVVLDSILLKLLLELLDAIELALYLTLRNHRQSFSLSLLSARW